ncbi:hypothetical protein PG995_002382 [Apiospora arundinis]|jgi:hypothetical protein|uniref:Uncharacterized protein n=1 Tax=Apiospora arundinis TaxID=335852 RepID=A0ABR2J5F9_9PEZI
MEALQLAQMLADLNDLQAAQDQGAAKALVSVNKTLDRKDNIQVQTLSAKTSSPDGRTVTTPAGRLDKFGRRIFTPPLSRTNSGTPSSIPGTPRHHDADGDIDRASTLLSLYEIRAKLKDQDNSSLMKAREKINALAAKQERLAREQATSAHPNGGLKSPGRISYPK